MEEEEVGRTRKARRKLQGGARSRKRHEGHEWRGCAKMLALRILRGKGVSGGKPKLNGPDGAHRCSQSNPILRGTEEKMPVC